MLKPEQLILLGLEILGRNDAHVAQLGQSLQFGDVVRGGRRGGCSRRAGCTRRAGHPGLHHRIEATGRVARHGHHYGRGFRGQEESIARALASAYRAGCSVSRTAGFSRRSLITVVRGCLIPAL